MKLNPNSKNAIKQFKHIKHLSISENIDDGFLDLFLLPINARNFDYNSVSDNLIESVADYALSWKIRDKYKDKAMALSKKAREKFKEATKNDGELGELLLFCFLEGHLEAPKILTKLELKTSNKLYVNGSDGVHLKKIAEQKYQLIFGESKTYSDLSNAFDDAFKSIGEFVNEINTKGNGKSGINFEKGLISRHIESDIFEKDEEEILYVLLYPEEKGNYKFSLDDAFSIFIGYEIDIKDEQHKCSNDEFPIEIEGKIVNQIETYKGNVYKLIQKYGLMGYTFYIFIMPFTNIDENRKKILKKVLE
jgi:hypothetical protein